MTAVATGLARCERCALNLVQLANVIGIDRSAAAPVNPRDFGYGHLYEAEQRRSHIFGIDDQEGWREALGQEELPFDFLPSGNGIDGEAWTRAVLGNPLCEICLKAGEKHILTIEGEQATLEAAAGAAAAREVASLQPVLSRTLFGPDSLEMARAAGISPPWDMTTRLRVDPGECP